ncbi:ethanolamine utilization protein EutH [Anaerovorax sp. IOR16]|uniref:ethanolamine utilization protein EutH n=1 Tax=Anaerovorax sp. IOR16 TaxID=2773458 RepID=UPI001AD8C5D6|nr:ethanolamine utilization protein EutH [Anaerovorax sp. IOR16]
MFNELIEAFDVSVLTSSLQSYVSNLTVNSIIVTIMTIFMLVGAVDKIRGNKLGYGEQFDEGFNAMGPLAIAMAGVVAAAPVLSILLKPFIAPIYTVFGADPAMFATTLLACDMGGYPLAMELAADETIGNFSGLILGSMMGPTIVFTIPVALSIIKKEDRPYLAAGVLAGLITLPLGCIAGGLVMNITPYKISLIRILINLIPVIIVAGLIVLGLWFKPTSMINGFNRFGTGVTIVITVFTAIAIFQYLTGIRFPLFDIMVDPDKNGGVVGLESGLLVCGQIAIVLAGAFPMVLWITNTFGGALERIGKVLGMNDKGSAGMVANLANNIAMFNILHEMNPKAKLLNVAFAVSAAFVFGDHLGFTAGNNPDMIFPVVVGKLVAGVTALILANALSPKLLSKIDEGNSEIAA